MLVVVSPAKNLDYESALPTTAHTQSDFLSHSEQLIEICKKLTPAQIASLMKVSDKIAGLNAARFAQWQQPFDLDNARQALYAFNGDVYVGLDAYSLTEKETTFAQSHLRILSGLYGLLRPLDLMQPYRLEMGTKLDNHRGKNLYNFWGDIITDALNDELKKQNSALLINLASTEYFKSVKPKKLNAEIVTPVFKDWKNGQYKMISFFAKKARGLMARYIIQNEISTIEQLKSFDVDGYQYSDELSINNELVFTRKQDA